MSGSHPTASGSPTFFFTTGYPINCHEYFVREMFPLETSRSEHLSSGIMKLHAKVVMEITFQIDLKDATKARQSLRRRQTCCVLLKKKRISISLLFSQMERLIGFRELYDCYV
jgi:hypothetical protein